MSDQKKCDISKAIKSYYARVERGKEGTHGLLNRLALDGHASRGVTCKSRVEAFATELSRSKLNQAIKAFLRTDQGMKVT